MMNLPFPRMVITSFTFTAFEGFNSFFPLIKTLSFAIISVALFLDVLAKSETRLSNRKEGTIILIYSTVTSFGFSCDIS